MVATTNPARRRRIWRWEKVRWVTTQWRSRPLRIHRSRRVPWRTQHTLQLQTTDNRSWWEIGRGNLSSPSWSTFSGGHYCCWEVCWKWWRLVLTWGCQYLLERGTSAGIQLEKVNCVFSILQGFVLGFLKGEFNKELHIHSKDSYVER